MKIYLEKFSIFLKINRHRMSTTSSFKVIRILRVKITSNFLFFLPIDIRLRWWVLLLLESSSTSSFFFIHWNQWILYSVLFFFCVAEKRILFDQNNLQKTKQPTAPSIWWNHGHWKPSNYIQRLFMWRRYTFEIKEKFSVKYKFGEFLQMNLHLNVNVMKINQKSN